MFSVDTNIFLYALNQSANLHVPAAGFIESLANRDDVAVSEFMLVELYVLLRNPAVLADPRTARDAMKICQRIRRHPRWQILGFPKQTREFHDTFWAMLGEPGFARRRIYDWRMALSLQHQGVKEFATVNVKDFKGFGFRKVWNPLT